ncbi:MAG: radical SAM protein [Candidatus Aenigmarchaeota archaeon]|nr:radical SAM protein [Candidatus Aenigmarchaeota archaeon]
MILKNTAQFFNILFSKSLGFRPKGPLFLYLEVTRKCNLKCEFCNIWMVKKKDPKMMNKEMRTDEILNIIGDAKEMGVEVVDIDGGEPLLRKDIYEIISEVEKQGMKAVLATNGTLITEKIAKKLIDSGLASVLVSLDAPTSERHDKVRGVKGSFRRAVSGIKILRKVGRDKIKIGINSLITRENIDLVKMAKFAKSIGVDGIRFLPYHLIYPHNIYSLQNKELFIRKEDDIKRLEKEIEDLLKFIPETGMYTNSAPFLRGISDYFRGKSEVGKCYAGYLYCDINCYGDLMPCLIREKTVNVRNSSFKDIWDSEEFEKIRKEISKTACKNCWHSCYIEPNIRMSPFYIMKNWRTVYQEIRSYLNV